MKFVHGVFVPCCSGESILKFNLNVWAPDNWAPGPNCPGPNLPLFGGGQLGPGQSGPGIFCYFFMMYNFLVI